MDKICTNQVAAPMPKFKIDYNNIKPYLFKIDTQMWKVHTELNLPDIFYWLLFTPGPLSFRFT